MNKQRQLIYSQRNEVLDGADVHAQILKYIEPIASSLVATFVNYETGDETTVDDLMFKLFGDKKQKV